MQNPLFCPISVLALWKQKIRLNFTYSFIYNFIGEKVNCNGTNLRFILFETFAKWIFSPFLCLPGGMHSLFLWGQAQISILEMKDPVVSHGGINK